MMSILLAVTIILTWPASTSTGVTGYKVFQGNAPGSYQTSVDVGNKLTHQLQVTDETSKYFAVASYNSQGRESNKTPEVILLGKPSAPTTVTIAVQN